MPSIVGTIFTIGKKIYDLHQAGADKKILKGIKAAVDALHGHVTEQHEAHGLHTEEGQAKVKAAEIAEDQ